VSESSLAFRAQLVIPEQQDVFAYWLSCCGDRAMPSRADFQPQGIRGHLSLVSLYDVTDDDRKFQVRLAGTGLRDVYQRDITGLTKRELPKELVGPLKRVVKTAGPAQGVSQVTSPERDDLIQFWLRMPMSNDGKTVNMVLGYDHFLPAEKAIALTQAHNLAQAS